MRLRINKVGLEADYFADLERPSEEFFSQETVEKYTHGILYFCPHCGTEFYGEWHCAKFYFKSKVVLYKYRENHPKKYKKYKKNSDLADMICDAASAFGEMCQAEMNQVREMQNCPVCSGTLKKDYGFFMELGNSWYRDDFFDYMEGYNQDYWGYSGSGAIKKFKSEFLKERADRWTALKYAGIEGTSANGIKYPQKIFPLVSGYEHMRSERMIHYQKIAAELVEEKSELFDLPVFEQLPIEKLGTVKNNPDTLKNYVHNLIKLETNIYSVKKRLEQLYSTRQDNECAARQAKYMPAGTQEILQEIADAEAAHSQRCAELARAKATPLKKVIIQFPEEPPFPQLETPGLFNKKRVKADNDKLIAEYKVIRAAYQQELAACEAEKERQETENRNALDRMIVEAEENVRAAKATLDEVNASAQQRIAAARKLPNPAEAIAQITEDEIREAEELLKNLYATRNKLYSYDIVFGKYRDVVALTSFYEYLMAGRCDSLEGAHGAYNIYESEIRANQVIAQLSAVLASLEQIQKNQYMVYTELKGIHSSLNKLNNTMGRALQSIQSIKANTDSMTSYMETIAQNTDVIAHNTAKTAYYAKINAELTNSLGFMMALN